MYIYIHVNIQTFLHMCVSVCMYVQYVCMYVSKTGRRPAAATCTQASHLKLLAEPCLGTRVERGPPPVSGLVMLLGSGSRDMGKGFSPCLSVYSWHSLWLSLCPFVSLSLSPLSVSPHPFTCQYGFDHNASTVLLSTCGVQQAKAC